jgi:hypothetical protein
MLQAERARELNVEYRLARPDESEAISELLLESFGLFETEYTPGAFEYTTPNTDVVRGRFDEGPICCGGGVNWLSKKLKGRIFFNYAVS